MMSENPSFLGEEMEDALFPNVKVDMALLETTEKRNSMQDEDDGPFVLDTVQMPGLGTMGSLSRNGIDQGIHVVDVTGKRKENVTTSSADHSSSSHEMPSASLAAPAAGADP